MREVLEVVKTQHRAKNQAVEYEPVTATGCGRNAGGNWAEGQFTRGGSQEIGRVGKVYP